MNPSIRSPVAEPAQAAPAVQAAVRQFGRFTLRRLIGKSERSMVWLAYDPRSDQDVTLTMPRVQPQSAAALEAWQRDAGTAARLNHPNLAAPSELGIQDSWPFLVVDRAYGLTLGEWLSTRPPVPMVDMVGWIFQALAGLAFAHEAGAVHGDLQFHSLLISEQGSVRVCGFATGSDLVGRQVARVDAREQDATDRLRARRAVAEHDVLAIGLIAYRLLSGHSPLDQDDVASVIARLPPNGREIVRLPWSTARPVPEALRAIVNRATAAQERQRYLSARSLLRVLGNWLEVERNEDSDPLVLLVDRLRSVGHLPAMPGIGQRISLLASAGAQRNDALALHVLQDMALSFELLRQVNAGLSRGLHSSGAAAVITVRRAVALLGLDGIRRAGRTLREWPGPLSSSHAAQLQHLIDQVRLAAQVAQVLRPAGYDPEVISLVVMWQNLGRLLIAYHFPDEATQIRLLIRNAPAPGIGEELIQAEAQASLAVLGVDSEAVGAAVAKYWGLGDEVQTMMRRCPVDRPVHVPEDDAGVLRVVASAANEIVELAEATPAPQLGAALALLARRYARSLGIDQKGLKDALQQARLQLSGIDAPPQKDESVHEHEPGVVRTG